MTFSYAVVELDFGGRCPNASITGELEDYFR